MARLRHFDGNGTVRFITFSCFRRYRLLACESAIKILLDELRIVRESHRLRLLGYVIMPNHVHLVVDPPENVRLGRVIGELKSKAARRILPVLKNLEEFRTDQLYGLRDGNVRAVLWQRRCYDHNCRFPETVIEKIEYCHKNPVRAGLVLHPGEWPWSSYSWYQGEKDVPIGIDRVRV